MEGIPPVEQLANEVENINIDLQKLRKDNEEMLRLIFAVSGPDLQAAMECIEEDDCLKQVIRCLGSFRVRFSEIRLPSSLGKNLKTTARQIARDVAGNFLLDHGRKNKEIFSNFGKIADLLSEKLESMLMERVS